MNPYWRTLKTGGLLNPKSPEGIERHKKLLENEGHIIMRKGSKYFVQNYQESIVNF